MKADSPHVVVVGAGFGGLMAARELAHADVRVTVVDRQNHHTFQPLLYQVATAGLGADDIASSVRSIFQRAPNVDFRLGEVTGVDVDGRQLLVAGEPPLPYDHLVLAAGATTNTFGVDGVAAHAHSLKTLGEALALRNQVFRLFEQAHVEPSLIDAGALTFVIIGGGPTGVELAGAFAELIHRVLRKDFHGHETTHARVVLLEATDHLLGAFSPPSRRYAADRLRQMGVEVRVGAQVERVTADGVHLRDGEVLRTRTAIWVAGVRATAVSPGLPLHPSGRVVVDGDLSVPGHPEISVVGDVAAATAPDGRLYPQLAPVAMQQGRHAAHQIVRRLQGRPTRPFRYVDKGTMATIGRSTAVAELPFRIRFRGFPAWVCWLGLHLIYLIGFRNRLNVLVNWAWNYVTWDRGARLIVAAGKGRPPVA